MSAVRLVWDRRLFAVVLLLIPPAAAFGQEPSIVRSLFLPAIYYVGDTVELRVSVRGGAEYPLTVPAELPQPDWGEIVSVEIISGSTGWEVRVHFVPLMPGIRELPAIDLGNLVLADFSVTVTSILDQEEATLRPPRSQYVLPGTGLFILIVFLLSVPSPVVAFLVIRLATKLVRRLIRWRKARLPARRLTQAIQRLRQSAEGMSARDFYIELLDETKGYLSSRMSLQISALTTTELKNVVAEWVSDEALLDRTHELFRYGDLVKFAGLRAPMGARMDHLATAEQLLAGVETGGPRHDDPEDSAGGEASHTPFTDRGSSGDPATGRASVRNAGVV